MLEETASPGSHEPQPRWQPLSRIDRRVAGVLIEKAKTTPSAYPMTLNAITTGCNQKSNRFPSMELTADDVEESLERLRRLGAAGVIEGSGRVDKFRHYLYDWLGVDKVELSVMAELLLRGPQTVGELRGRASRMDPIPDLAAMHAILESLKGKGLVVALTPEGRGQVVTHALYPAEELARIRAQHGPVTTAGFDAAADRQSPPPAAGPPPARREPAVSDRQVAEGLGQLVEELRREVAQLRTDLDGLTAAHEKTEEELRRLREDLGA
ncbi:MAG: DUF480 domain-containing protein [Thermoguttaceae bacterium]|jgi:uncharacterized protein YceH (UPF0502 family)